jgi:hypothetical protein
MTDVINKLDTIEQKLNDWDAQERSKRVRRASFLLATEVCVAYAAGLLIHNLWFLR